LFGRWWTFACRMAGCEFFAYWRRMKTGRRWLQSGLNYFKRTSYYCSCSASHSTQNKRGINANFMIISVLLSIYDHDC